MLAAVFALAIVGISYFAFFVKPAERVEAPAPVAAETLRIAALSPLAEVSPNGPDAGTRWDTARVGSVLSLNDWLHTDDEGAALLKAADESTIQVEPATEAKIEELSR